MWGPMARRPTKLGRSFWLVLLFGLLCVLAGVAFTLAVPRFSRPKVPPHAPAPLTGSAPAPPDDAMAALTLRLRSPVALAFAAHPATQPPSHP
jgi:hypothetical protein